MCSISMCCPAHDLKHDRGYADREVAFAPAVLHVADVHAVLGHASQHAGAPDRTVEQPGQRLQLLQHCAGLACAPRLGREVSWVAMQSAIGGSIFEATRSGKFRPGPGLNFPGFGESVSAMALGSGPSPSSRRSRVRTLAFPVGIAPLLRFGR